MPLTSPPVSPADPPWVVDLKLWMARACEAINAAVTRGDGTTTLVNRGVVSAVQIPQLCPVKITGAIDANGYYPCSVYKAGTADTAPLTSQLLKLWNMDVPETEEQGFWLASPAIVDIDGTDTEIWEAVNTLPQVPADLASPRVNDFALVCINGQVKWLKPPDNSGVYVLASVAGSLDWWYAGECGATTTTTGA